MRLLEGLESRVVPRPVASEGVDRVEACAWSRPASDRGRTAFDHWPLPDGRLALFLGDASDHGPDGPRILSELRGHLRALTQVRAVPDWLLAQLNKRLLAGSAPGHLLTAFVGCLGSDGRLEWCSAGQGPVYVSRRTGEDYDAVPAQAPPLGEEADLRVHSAVLRLGPGGRVIVLSDGLIEADNPAGQPFGARRVKTVLDNTAGLPVEKVVALVRDVVVTWQGGAADAHDQSLLVAGLSE
jgi:sigma-B regulation protein RsbU (phosphoserine phosphatase)